MGKSNFSALCADIDLELTNLNRLGNELKETLPKVGNPPNSFEVRAIGSILHDFYTGAEKIFENIAVKVDQDIPASSGWHVQLLKRMGTELPNTRPVVINKELEEKLMGYLSFRHLFRNIYGFELKWDRCKELTTDLENTYNNLNKQLAGFKSFLLSI